jgi:hypothetical protein
MKTLIKFLYKWSEFLVIPLALFIFWISPIILRKADPTAGVYDWGIFQVILFATVAFFFSIGVVRLGMKLFAPDFERWFDNEFPKTFTSKETSLWQKSVLSMWLFSLYLLSFVLLARII